MSAVLVPMAPLVPALDKIAEPRILYPMYGAMYDEACQLARTEQDHENVRHLCNLAISDRARRHLDRQVPQTCEINAVPDDWK